MFRIQRLVLLLICTVILSACNISGTITDEDGAGLAGVTVALTGAANLTTTTNADGNYNFGFLGTGDYQITPSLAGSTFSPDSIALTKSGLFVNEMGNDFVAAADDLGTLIFEKSMVYLGVDMTLSVYEGETEYTFELFRNGTATEAENAGCVVDNVVNSVAISKDVVLNMGLDSTVDDLIYPIFADPSGDVTDVTIRQYDSDFLQFVAWVHPDDGCPSTDLHFEIEPNIGVIDGETLEDFFERLKAYLAGPVFEKSMVYIGVDMTLSVYEGADDYFFELFRDGTSTGGSSAGCETYGETDSVVIAKDVLLALGPDSDADNSIYPIYDDPPGDVTQVTIREYDSEFLQLVVWIHPDIACPSTDLHFEVEPNTGVFAGETLEDFFNRF